MTIGGAATRDCTAYQLSAACIPLSGYVRLSPRERRAFTDGLPASFMRACYKIRQYTTECIREGVFHLSFVDLVFLSACMQLFGSRDPLACIRRPLVLGCAPSLSGVSQLLSVCFPADWLQRGRDPGGIACKRTAPAELLQQPRQEFGNCPSFRAVKHSLALLVSVFPGCQNRRQPFRKLRRCVSFHAVRLWAACPAVFFCPAALMQALEHVRHLCRVSLNCIPESQRARAPSCGRGGQAETVSRLIRECLGRKEV